MSLSVAAISSSPVQKMGCQSMGAKVVGAVDGRAQFVVPNAHAQLEGRLQPPDVP
jgi:hypothetical protein